MSVHPSRQRPGTGIGFGALLIAQICLLGVLGLIAVRRPVGRTLAAAPALPAFPGPARPTPTNRTTTSSRRI